MKKPALFLIALVVGAILADRLASVAFNQLLLRSDFRVSRLYRGDARGDLLVLGNSRAIHMLDVPDINRLACRDTFSLALNGLDTETEDVLVSDYLGRNPPPRVALVEISSLTKPEIAAKEYAQYSLNSAPLRRLIAAQDQFNPWRHLLNLYDFNGQMPWRTLAYLGRKDEQASAPMDGRLTPAIIAAYEAGTKPLSMQPDRIPALRRTIERLEARGVKVIPILAPYHASVLDHRIDKAEFLRVAESGLKRPVVDLSGELKADQEFADPLHMSRLGRKTLAPTLAGLVSNCNAPAARTAANMMNKGQTAFGL